MLTSPVPSIFGGRVSRETRFEAANCSSAVSSMVTSLSPSGIHRARAFNVEVFPDPVPPEINILSRARIHACIKCAICLLMLSSSTSRSRVKGSAEKRRMVRAGDLSARGGIMALTRDPSGNRASTNGVDSSTRRPRGATLRSITFRMCCSSRKVAWTGSNSPSFSTKITSGELTIISVTWESFR